jgi:LITAF-like zinc ribbon domain
MSSKYDYQEIEHGRTPILSADDNRMMRNTMLSVATAPVAAQPVNVQRTAGSTTSSRNQYVAIPYEAQVPVATAIPEHPSTILFDNNSVQQQHHQQQYFATAPVDTDVPPSILPSVPIATEILVQAIAVPQDHHKGNIHQQQQQQQETHTQNDVVQICSVYPVTIPLCPNCNETNVRTKTRTSPDIITIGIVVVLFFIWWPICWIPLCIRKCKRTQHYCSKCHTEIATIQSVSQYCVSHSS